MERHRLESFARHVADVYNDALQRLKDQGLSAVSAAIPQAAAASGAIASEMAAAAGAATSMLASFGPLAAVTAAMLALQAAIGGVLHALNASAEAASRLDAARQKQSDQGVQDRAGLAARAAAVGITGATDIISKDVAALQDRGLLSGQAENVAFARRLAASAGQPFDADRFFAGMVGRGGKPIDLTPKPDKGKTEAQAVQAEIEAVQREGQDPQRMQQADRVRFDQREAALRQAAEHPPEAVRTDRKAMIETEIIRLVSERPELAEDANRLRAILQREGRIEEVAPGPLQALTGWRTAANVAPEGVETVRLSSHEAIVAAADAMKRVADRLEQHAARPDATPVVAPPIQNVTNIGSVHNSIAPWGRPADVDPQGGY